MTEQTPITNETECESCLEAGETRPATTRSRNPEFSGYALCEECAAEYDSRMESEPPTEQWITDLMDGLQRGEYPVYVTGRGMTTLPREDLPEELLDWLRQKPEHLSMYYCHSPKSGRCYRTTDQGLAQRRHLRGWRVHWSGLSGLFLPDAYNPRGGGMWGAGDAQAAKYDSQAAQYHAMQQAAWASLVRLRAEIA